MTLLTAKHLQKPLLHTSEDLFSLVIRHQMIQTSIDMNVYTSTVNTRDIPWTYSFLQRSLPSILASTCYNEEKLPFSMEVTRTELGHLFEHILLEYLCQEKLLRGHNEAVFSGKTKWNWEKEPFGLFHISISMHNSDREIFPEALDKSILLFKKLLQNDAEEMFLTSPLTQLTSTQNTPSD